MNFVLIVFAFLAFAQAQNEPSTVSESASGIKENEKQISEEAKNTASSGVTENSGRSSGQNVQNVQNGGFGDPAYQNFNGFNGQPNYDNLGLGAFRSFADYSLSSNNPSIQFSSDSYNNGLRTRIGADGAQGGAQSESSVKVESSGSESSAANGDAAAKAKNTANIGETNSLFANSVFSTPATYDNGFGFGDSNLYNAGLRVGDSPFANFEKIITSNGQAADSTKSAKTGESSIPDDASQQELKYANNLAAIPKVSDGILNGLFRSEDISQDSGSSSNNEFDSSPNNNQQSENESSSGSAKLNEDVKETNEETGKNVPTTEATPVVNPTLASFAPSTAGRFDASLFGSNINYPQFNSFDGFDSSVFSTASPLLQNSYSLTGSTTAAPAASKSAAAVPTTIPSDAVTISTPEVTVPTPTGKTTVDASIVKSGLPALSQLSLLYSPQSTLTPFYSTVSPFINGGSLSYPSYNYPLYDSIYSSFLPGSNYFGGSFGIGAPIQGIGAIQFPQYPSFPTTPSPVIDSSTFNPPNTVTISGDSVSVSAPNVDSSVPTPVDKPVEPAAQQAETTPQPDNEPVVEIAGSSMKSAKVSTESESESEKVASKVSVEVTEAKENAAVNTAKLFADATKLNPRFGLTETFPSFSGALNPTFYNTDSIYSSSAPSYFNSNPGDFGISQFGFGNGNAFGSDLGSISTSNIFKKKRQS